MNDRARNRAPESVAEEADRARTAGGCAASDAEDRDEAPGASWKEIGIAALLTAVAGLLILQLRE